MPYANAYNANIARALHGVNQKHINVENAINDNPVPVDITSQLEGMTLKNPAAVGGNGFAASTVQDLGFEPTLGATGTAKPKNARRKMDVAIADANVAIADALAGGSHDRRVVGEGVAGAGVAGAGVAGAGKKRKKKGGLLTLTALDSMEGNQGPNVDAKLTVQARPHVSEQVGTAEQIQAPATTAALQGGARKKRNDLVREIMKKHKLSLPAASKYIKEHRLY